MKIRRAFKPIPLIQTLIVVVVNLMVALAIPCSAQVEFGALGQETTPTSATLNDVEFAGFSHAGTGEALAVGDGATVIRRTLSGGQPAWQSFDTWAAGFFSGEIFDVATSPVSSSNGPVWALAGRDVVLETDLTTTTVIDDRQGAGTVFTPVMPTIDEVWYGAPNLSGSGAPGFIHRYDRVTAQAPGVAEFSPVADICQVPGGNARYVTLAGDVTEIDDQLQRTLIFDQPNNNSLDMTYARFSDGCNTLIGGGIVGPSSVATFTLDLVNPTVLDRSTKLLNSVTSLAGPSWQVVPMDGWSVPIAADSFFDIAYQVTLFAACDDVSLTSNIYAYFRGRFEALSEEESFQISESCLTRSITYDTPSFNRPHFGNELQQGSATSDGRLDLMTVGEGGVVLRIPVTLPLFFANFETGDFSEWTFVVN